MNSQPYAELENKNNKKKLMPRAVAAVLLAAGVAAGGASMLTNEVSGTPVAEQEKDLTGPEIQEIADQMLDYDCAVTQAFDTGRPPERNVDGGNRDEVQFSVKMTPKTPGDHPSIDMYGAGGVLHMGSPLSLNAIEGGNINVISGSFDEGGNSPASIEQQADGSYVINTQIYPREYMGVEDPQIDLFVYTGNEQSGVKAIMPCGTMVKNGDSGEMWSVVKPRETDITAEAGIR